MKEAFHTAIAEEVARWLGWPDASSVGKGAAAPDQIEVFTVPGLGARFAGCNISCMMHFAGYNLHMDTSLGIDLPNVDIRYNAGAWSEIPQGMEPGEPLFELLSVKGYTHAFDEITYPAAWSYAAWLEQCFIRACELTIDSDDSRQRDRRLATIAGYALHYVQDMTVPHHRHNVMLAGHSGFEEQCLRRWEKMPSSERSLWINDQCGRAARWSARGAAQGCMIQIGKLPSTWSCLRKKDVDRSIRQCVRVTAAVLKNMKEYL